MHIELRKSVDTDLGGAVRTQFAPMRAVMPVTQVSAVDAACVAIQELRARTIADNAQLVDLEKYFAELYAIAPEYHLNHTKFAWSNSLGTSKTLLEGSGVWYELLNTGFNLAAKLANKVVPDEASCGRAAGVFAFVRDSVLPHLDPAEVPLELKRETFSFLETMCLARATELEAAQITASKKAVALKWETAERYKQALARLDESGLVLGIHRPDLPQLIGQWELAALLELGQECMHSRKKQDQVVARTAFELVTSNAAAPPDMVDEANAHLNAPLGRRKSSLRELQGTADLADYLRPATSPATAPEWSPAPSTLFSQVLPPHLAHIPALLKEDLLAAVKSKLSDQNTQQQRAVLAALVQSNLPAGIELIQDPGHTPPSLVRLGAEITAQGGVAAIIKELRTKEAGVEAHAKAPLTPSDDTNLKSASPKSDVNRPKSAGAVSTETTSPLMPASMSAKFQALHSVYTACRQRIEDVAPLLEVLAAGPAAIAEFIQHPPSKNVTPRKTVPSALARVTALADDFSATSRQQASRLGEIRHQAAGIEVAGVIAAYYREQNHTAYGQDDREVLLSHMWTLLPHTSEAEAAGAHLAEMMPRIAELATVYTGLERGTILKRGKIRSVHALLYAGTVLKNVNIDAENAAYSLGRLERVASMMRQSKAKPVASPDKENVVYRSPLKSTDYAWQRGAAINIT